MHNPQTFENHARSIPIYHRFALPVLVINIIVALVAIWRSPGLSTVWQAVVASALFVGILWGRVQALTAQNRVIRLEETLRMRALLPASQQGDIAQLSAGQLIALRFASDEELPALVQRVRAGEFAKPQDIKRAISNWRPDYLRV